MQAVHISKMVTDMELRLTVTLTTFRATSDHLPAVAITGSSSNYLTALLWGFTSVCPVFAKRHSLLPLSKNSSAEIQGLWSRG